MSDCDSELEYEEDDLPDFEDDDEAERPPPARSSYKPPPLLTSSDDLLEAVAASLADAEAAAVPNEPVLSCYWSLLRLFQLEIARDDLRLPATSDLPECEALADMVVSSLWVSAARQGLDVSRDSACRAWQANLTVGQLKSALSGPTEQPDNSFRRVLIRLLLECHPDELPELPASQTHPVLADHPSLAMWEAVGGIRALEAAVEQKLRAHAEDTVLLLRARARALAPLAATCKSLRRVLRVRILRYFSNAMRVLTAKLLPITDDDKAALSVYDPHSGIPRHQWLLAPPEPGRELRAGEQYASLSQRHLSAADESLLRWALERPGRLPANMDRLSITGGRIPVYLLGLAGFRNERDPGGTHREDAWMVCLKRMLVPHARATWWFSGVRSFDSETHHNLTLTTTFVKPLQ